jgi:hypothetical protein
MDAGIETNKAAADAGGTRTATLDLELEPAGLCFYSLASAPTAAGPLI